MKRLVVLSIVLVFACGKRGDPRPPVPAIPKATSDLVVTQRANKLLLSWSYPALTTAGRNLTKIQRVTVFRYTEELPATPTAVQGTLPLPLSAARFAKLSNRVDSIESANLPASTVGAKLVFEDEPPLHSSSGRPVRITYAVVTEGLNARGDLSNLVSIVPLDVAVPPAHLTATPKAEGVVLQWTAPEAAVTGDAKPAIAGYNIYRVARGVPPDTFAAPVNAAPVKTTDFLDVPPYGSYEYSVAAVAAEGPPRMESDRSSPIEATFKDLVPPPPPASVTALVETRVVRLVWDAVDAPDLSGYNVYRTEKAGRVQFNSKGPIHQTFFGDESLLPGIEYYYSVTSVDKSGNESAETRSQTVLVPKTP